MQIIRSNIYKLRPSTLAAVTALAGLGFAGNSWADPVAAAPAVAASAAQAAAPNAQAQSAQSQSVWTQDSLSGDWGGARTRLKDQGTTVALNYIGEVWDVAKGGLDQRSNYAGRLEFSVDSDLEKLAGWKDSAAHITLYNTHSSRHNAGQNVGGLVDPSNIDALSSTRLFTAWVEKGFWDKKVSVRVGQLAADDEFLVSNTASNLISSTFGWAVLPAVNMPNGGPAFPMAAPGVRVKLQPNDQFTVLAGVFKADPAAPDCGQAAQRCDSHGLRMALRGGPLWLGEAQYNINQEADAKGMPGSYKLGAWYVNHDAADMRYGLNAAGTAVSLSDPTMVAPLQHKGNRGIYAVADQMVWRGKDSSLSVFVRGGATPANRNLVSSYVDAGLGWKAPFASRPDDVLSLGLAYSKISSAAVGADLDALAAGGAPYAVRNKEVALELAYTMQLAPWWTLKPDLQYIAHPNGGQNASNPTLGVKNAVVVGLRSTIAF